MTTVPENQPRPLTRAELLEWLGNIPKMHAFGEACTYGSAAHKLYHDGMSTCADFVRRCVELTPVGTL